MNQLRNRLAFDIRVTMLYKFLVLVIVVAASIKAKVWYFVTGTPTLSRNYYFTTMHSLHPTGLISLVKRGQHTPTTECWRIVTLRTAALPWMSRTLQLSRLLHRWRSYHQFRPFKISSREFRPSQWIRTVPEIVNLIRGNDIRFGTIKISISHLPACMLSTSPRTSSMAVTPSSCPTGTP